MTARRFSEWTIRAGAITRFGVNAVTAFNSPAALQAIYDMGARAVRVQPAWSATENYATGVLALHPLIEAGLAKCAQLGMEVHFVAGYGPPWTNLGNLTVAAPGAVIGDYVIPVTGASLAQFEFPYSFTYKAAGGYLTADTGALAYYGHLITAADASSITLAAPLNVNLTAGTALLHNRLRYKPIWGAFDNAASVAAYMRYAKFLAQKIADAGLTGYVGVWNELPWVHDSWLNLGRFYTPQSPTDPNYVAVDRMQPILTEALNTTDLPTGVRFLSEAPGKSRGNSVVFQGLATTASQLRQGVSAEAIHPYEGIAPERSRWDKRDLGATGIPTPMDPTSAGNFYLMDWDYAAFALAHGGARPLLVSTEYGAYLSTVGVTADRERRSAVDLVRGVLSLWACESPVLVYDFAEATAYSLAGPSPTFTLKHRGEAMRRVCSMVASLGGSQAHGASALVTVLSHSEQASRFKSAMLNIYGSTGAICIVWLRSRGPDGVTLFTDTGPYADQASVKFSVPPGHGIAEVTNLIDGATVTTIDLGGGQYELAYGEEPIAIRTT